MVAYSEIHLHRVASRVEQPLSCRHCSGSSKLKYVATAVATKADTAAT
jgi:hypothetical protein